MKLDINKKAIKKGLLYSGLGLTCLGILGFSKKDVKDTGNNTTYETSIDNETTEEETLSIDTIQTLDAYNEYLESKNISIDENDLEVLAYYGAPIVMVKSQDGYSQIGEDYYVAITKDKDLDIVSSNMPGESKYDMISGKKLSEGKLYNSYQSVIEFIITNDIEPVGYALPYHIAYTTSDMHMIESIYGKDVAACAKEIGIPVKVYSASDFYEVKEKSTEKVMIKK